jgi:hypothetical protein
MLNMANNKIRRGVGLKGRAGIFIDQEIADKNSGITTSTRSGEKSSKGGLTIQFGRPYNLNKHDLINGGMGG